MSGVNDSNIALLTAFGVTDCSRIKKAILTMTAGSLPVLVIEKVICADGETVSFLESLNLELTKNDL